MKKRLLLLPALALVLSACTGPAAESAPTGTPGESLSPVYTDWSKLESYRPDRGLYTRYYDRPVDRLLAVEGGYGGPLVPFVGSRQGGADGWGSLIKYGLATADGTVVCDPVYRSVYTENGCLVLRRIGVWAVPDRVTVAAPDGSWVLESEYRAVWSMSDGRLLLADTAGGLWFCDGSGALTPSPLNEELARRQEADWEALLERGSFYDGTGIFPEWERSESWLLNAATGEVKCLPDVAYCYGWPDGDPLAVAQSADEKWGYLDRNGDWAIPPQFRWAGEFRGDCAEAELAEGGSALIDRSGRVVARIQGSLYTATDRNGTVYYLDRTWDETGETITAIYDEKGQLLPDHPLAGREGTVYLYYCAFATAEDQVIGNSTVRDGIMTLWDYDGTVLGTVEWAQGISVQSCENSRAVLHRWTAADGTSSGVYDLETGAWVVPMEKYSNIQVSTDGSDMVYLAWPKYADGYDILRADGTFIAHVDIFDDFAQGLLRCERGNAAVWLDLNGEETFRWPIQSNSD